MPDSPDLPNCRPTGIGSTPHTDPAQAVDFVLEVFPEAPCWPQLPRRTFRENMYVQFSERLPGVRIESDTGRIYVQLDDVWPEQAEPFYQAFLEGEEEADADQPAHLYFATGPDYAAGLHEFLRRGPLDGAWIVKGQLTGPVSIGIQVTDQNRRATFYDEMVRDAIVKNLLRQAQWQEAQLRKLCPRTLISIDEPILAMFGSAFAAFSRQDVIAALEEVFSGLQGWKATHCCANTDWSLLMETSVDVLLFDAYEYAEHITLYPEELRRFLARGGMLGWGILPNTGEAAETITLDGAWEALERALACFERKGFDRRELLPRSFITPACGVGTLPLAMAERILRLTRAFSDQVRQGYGLGLS